MLRHESDGTGRGQLTNPAGLTSTSPTGSRSSRATPAPRAPAPTTTRWSPPTNACTTPNRQHAAPLNFASCNPPTQTSTQLTLGTPDANLKPAASVSSLRIGVIPAPRRPARRRRGEPDHLGHRRPQRQRPHRLHRQPRDAGPAADHRQVQHALPRRTGTGHRGGLHLHLERPLFRHEPIRNIGADCSLFTTADTLLPGSALEGRRAIWQTDQIEVRDGAGQPFLRQGVFVP